VLLDTAACRSRARRRSQKKGDYYCTSSRDVSTSTPNSTLYYARARLPHWPDLLCSHRAGDQENIYRCDLAIALKKSSVSTKYTPSHNLPTCSRPSEPSNTHAVPRIIRCQSSHLHRAVPFPVYCHARLYIRMAAAAASRAP
jgi:hypothetical protein